MLIRFAFWHSVCYLFEMNFPTCLLLFIRKVMRFIFMLNFYPGISINVLLRDCLFVVLESYTHSGQKEAERQAGFFLVRQGLLCGDITKDVHSSPQPSVKCHLGSQWEPVTGVFPGGWLQTHPLPSTCQDSRFPKGRPFLGISRIIRVKKHRRALVSGCGDPPQS